MFNVSGCSVQLVLYVQVDARIESESFNMVADLNTMLLQLLGLRVVAAQVTVLMMISAAHCSGKSIGVVNWDSILT
jgi:hypothetical protein